MTGHDGRTALDEAAVEELLTGRADPADPYLLRAVALLGTVADGPAPPPSAALADLLERGVEPVAVPFRRPAPARRRWAARTGAGVAAAAASVVLAGTAAALPPSLQETVADVVGALTPFELPRPPAETGPPRPAEDRDDASPAATPVPARTRAPERTIEPPAGRTGAPAPTSDDSDDPDRQAREQQRAAEEAAEESAEQSQRAAEEAAEDSQRAAEDAADEAEDAAEDAARDAARKREDAADRAADEAEDAEDG